MSGEFSDETLNAYLDGELHADERAAFERELVHNAGLRERLEQLRGVMQLMQQEFADTAGDTVPDALLVAARDLASIQGAAVVALKPKARVQSFARWQLPLAACVALVVGSVVGGAFQSWRDRMDLTTAVATLDAGQIAPENPLFVALEKTPSGESVTTADASRLHLILSFAAKDGRFCREFDVNTPRAASVGIACKNNGAWRLEVLLAATPLEPGAYRPASGYNAKAFDDAVTSLMDGAPLEQAKEQSLIESGWRKAQ